MTDIQRYEPWPQEWPMEDANGGLVTYEDHRKVVEAVEAERDALRERVARLEGAGDFARLIGNDASKDDKDTVLVTYGMLRRLRDALTDGDKHA